MFNITINNVLNFNVYGSIGFIDCKVLFVSCRSVICVSTVYCLYSVVSGSQNTDIKFNFSVINQFRIPVWCSINFDGYIAAYTIRNFNDNICRIAIGYVVDINDDIRSYLFYIESCHIGDVVEFPVSWEFNSYVVFSYSQV